MYAQEQMERSGELRPEELEAVAGGQSQDRDRYSVEDRSPDRDRDRFIPDRDRSNPLNPFLYWIWTGDR